MRINKIKQVVIGLTSSENRTVFKFDILDLGHKNFYLFENFLVKFYLMLLML